VAKLTRVPRQHQEHTQVSVPFVRAVVVYVVRGAKGVGLWRFVGMDWSSLTLNPLPACARCAKVLRYENGQYYGSHNDYWDPDFYQSADMLEMTQARALSHL